MVLTAAGTAALFAGVVEPANIAFVQRAGYPSIPAGSCIGNDGKSDSPSAASVIESLSRSELLLSTDSSVFSPPRLAAKRGEALIETSAEVMCCETAYVFPRKNSILQFR